MSATFQLQLLLIMSCLLGAAEPLRAQPGAVAESAPSRPKDASATAPATFNEFGVQIMSPAFESQPERAVVVPKSRWYPAPAVPPRDETPATEKRGERSS